MFTGVTDLIIEQDESHISLWGLNGKDQLVYTNLKKQTELGWQIPIILAKEITEITAYRNHTNEANVVLYGQLDGQIEYMHQDADSTLWNKFCLSIYEPEHVVEINSFSSVIEVKDEFHVPMGGVKVNIRPSFDCTVQVNGDYYKLSTLGTKEWETDPKGSLSIVFKCIL